MITPEHHDEFLEGMFPDTWAMISIRMTNYCSHGCHYCIDGDPSKRARKPKGIEVGGVDKFIKHILHLGSNHPIEYRLTGGEPTESPYFEDVFRAIADQKKHKIRVMTDCLPSKFLKILKDYKREDVNLHTEASCHFGAYLTDKHDKRLKLWKKNVKGLVEKSTSVVMVTPLSALVLKNIDQLYEIIDMVSDHCKKHDVKFGVLPTELYGRDLDGRRMPEEYTEKELEIVTEINKKWHQRNSYNPAPRTNFSVFDENRRGEQRSKIGTSWKLTGQECYYTKMFYVIDTESGVIIPCGSGQPAMVIGNILDWDRVVSLEKIISHNNRKAHQCPYMKCGCILKGELACLTPNRMSADEYINNNTSTRTSAFNIIQG